LSGVVTASPGLGFEALTGTESRKWFWARDFGCTGKSGPAIIFPITSFQASVRQKIPAQSRTLFCALNSSRRRECRDYESEWLCGEKQNTIFDRYFG